MYRHLNNKPSVERVYDTFTRHVAEGRKMNQNDVDSIGQGRVWSAIDAKHIGLVDVLGGIDDAIKIAAKMAHLNNYRIISLPEQKDSFTDIIKQLTGDDETSIMQKKLGVDYKYLRSLQYVLKMQGVQALMPYSLEWN